MNLQQYQITRATASSVQFAIKTDTFQEPKFVGIDFTLCMTETNREFSQLDIDR